MDYLYAEPTGKKRKGTRQRASNKINFRSQKGTSTTQMIPIKKAERTKANKSKAHSGKKGLFHVGALNQG